MCFIDEHIFLTFKKTEKGWVKCEEGEAEIGLVYCDVCNCAQMVHETYFMDESFKDYKRPYEHLFWEKVDYGWTGFDDNINLRLYNEIYGKQFKINEYITLKLENEKTNI